MSGKAMADSPNLSAPVASGERYLVFGAARSGAAAVELLARHGRTARVLDEGDPSARTDMIRRFEELETPARFGPASPDDLNDIDAVILSPGIPTSHSLVAEARARGIGVYSELELGWAFSPAPLIAVTGSNGKTTVTGFIAHFLRAAGIPTLEAGNIGRALSEAAMDPIAREKNALLVVEASSYQLETIDRFHPRAAVILNVTPDHLNRYGDSIDAYGAAKERIAKNLKEDDAFVVNQDDARCLAMAERAKARIWRFSTIRPVERGAYLSENVMLFGDGKFRSLVELDAAPVRGFHNVSNLLAAASVARFLRLPVKSMREAATTVSTPPHRLQFIADIAGVSYYNDSKATNIDAAMRAMESFPGKVILLAGGQDKNSPFADAASRVEGHLKRLIAFGEAGPTIREHWGRKVSSDLASDLESALKIAAECATPGDVVLLSPACASFDQFDNFEHRGRTFIDLVEGMKESSP